MALESMPSPFETEGPGHYLPSSVNLANPHRVRDQDVAVESHIRALTQSHDGGNLNSRCVHWHEEDGEPLVFRHFGVGSCKEHHVGGHFRTAREDLLSVDDPRVTVSNGRRSSVRNIRAAVGFAVSE